MVEKRKPLILSSTKALLDSLLNPSNQLQDDDQFDRHHLSAGVSSSGIELRAGILRFHKDKTDISNIKIESLDDAALVGLSTRVLKKLSITSGSLVCLFDFLIIEFSLSLSVCVILKIFIIICLFQN